MGRKAKRSQMELQIEESENSQEEEQDPEDPEETLQQVEQATAEQIRLMQEASLKRKDPSAKAMISLDTSAAKKQRKKKSKEAANTSSTGNSKPAAHKTQPRLSPQMKKAAAAFFLPSTQPAGTASGTILGTSAKGPAVTVNSAETVTLNITPTVGSNLQDSLSEEASSKDAGADGDDGKKKHPAKESPSPQKEEEMQQDGDEDEEGEIKEPAQRTEWKFFPLRQREYAWGFPHSYLEYIVRKHPTMQETRKQVLSHLTLARQQITRLEDKVRVCAYVFVC